MVGGLSRQLDRQLDRKGQTEHLSLDERVTLVWLYQENLMADDVTVIAVGRVRSPEPRLRDYRPSRRRPTNGHKARGITWEPDLPVRKRAVRAASRPDPLLRCAQRTGLTPGYTHLRIAEEDHRDTCGRAVDHYR